MDKDAALTLALAFIERVNREGWVLADFEGEMYAAIAAIKDALEWQGLTERDVKTITENAPSAEWAVRMAESTLREKNGAKRTKAEWRGLTGDEMEEIYAGNDGTRSRRRILDLIEDRLKEKNT